VGGGGGGGGGAGGGGGVVGWVCVVGLGGAGSGPETSACRWGKGEES